MMLIVLMDFNLNWMITGCGTLQMVTFNALTVFAILKLVTQISIRQRVHFRMNSVWDDIEGEVKGPLRELWKRRMLKDQWILPNLKLKKWENSENG